MLGSGGIFFWFIGFAEVGLKWVCTTVLKTKKQCRKTGFMLATRRTASEGRNTAVENSSAVTRRSWGTSLKKMRSSPEVHGGSCVTQARLS